MFFARIRFDTKDNIHIAYEEQQIQLFRKGSAICVLGGCGETINASNELYLEYGGFNSFEEAHHAGQVLFIELKMYCISRHISIKISGGPGLIDTPDFHTDTGGFTTYGRKALNVPDNAKNDALGLKVYEVKKSMRELTFIHSKAGGGLLIHDFTLSGKMYEIGDDNPLISISLLTVANAMNADVRISFLMKIMAVEALVSKEQKRNKEVQKMIDEVLEGITDNDLRSYLGSYKNKSIKDKCTEIVEQYCSGNAYADSSATDFWVKCYKLRSNFVHTGELAYEKVSKVNGPLGNLVYDLLQGVLQK